MTDTFTDDLAAILQTRNAYVNIHTANNPSGEVRGQLVKAPDCPFVSAVIDVNGETFDLEVFPNPVANILKVKYTGNAALYNNNTIHITDISGRLMFTKMTNDNESVIDMTTFAPGIYLMQSSNNNYSTTIKLVKL